MRQPPIDDAHYHRAHNSDEDRAMWMLLQDHRAMMDWIAVPHFLAAGR